MGVDGLGAAAHPGRQAGQAAVGQAREWPIL